MTLVDLIALAFATGGIVDCWFNGSILAGPRRRLAHLKPFGCDYCMNWQVPLWLLFICLLPAQFLPEPWAAIFRLPVYWQAAAYWAWIVNDWRGRHECDYARTARIEEAKALYGGADPELPEPPVPEPPVPEIPEPASPR